MQNHYFVTGAWGFKSGNVTILSHWSNLLTAKSDGTPEDEADAINRAIQKMEDKSFRDLESELTRNGVIREYCSWQYLNLCPLKSSL